jgi:putative Holliday junction resolvase
VAGLVLGFDFGKRRIGVAVGQPLTGSASPQTVVQSTADGNPDWTAIEALVTQWAPNALVVGRPGNMDGTDSPMTAAAEAFAEALAERTGMVVALVDERLTSFDAMEALRAQRREGTRKRRIRREDVDALAAKLIVESYLSLADGDAHAMSTVSPGKSPTRTRPPGSDNNDADRNAPSRSAGQAPHHSTKPAAL